MPSNIDPRGHALSSRHAAATDACNAGIDSYNCWRADAVGHLDRAIAEDADFALPKLAKGWVLHMGRSTAFAGKILELIADSERCIAPGDDRERDYLAALKLASSGRGIEASTILESLLIRHPTDLLAHRLVQFELFWNGRVGWMRGIAERAAGYWNAELPGYGDFLSCRAFAAEECGDYPAAERYGRAAVDIANTDVWGAHAIAHVLVMQGRIDDGVEWLEGLSGNWADANQLQHHLWWHLCLFLLERGEHERIFTLLTSKIRDPQSPLVQAAPEATIDIQNVASILLRLELRGVAVADHWQVLADICSRRVHDHGNAFTNAHDMMVLTATEQFDRAEEMLESMREFGHSGEGNLGASYRSAGTALCAAILAHRRRNYTDVITHLSPVRHDLSLIGGSHAQRDLFYQLLIDAAHREGRADLVPLYLDDVRRIGFEAVDERTLYAALH
jgi:hypothetical protein